MSYRDEVLIKKKSKIDDLNRQLDESDAVFFTEYRGLTVSQMDTLRSSLRDVSASCIVMKNSLVKRAFSNAGIQCLDHVLKGPTAIIISTKDGPVVASKICKFQSSNDALVLKGGYLDGAFISQDDVKSLSKLPPRDVLMGQFVAGLKASLSRFVMSVNVPVRLVYLLEAIKIKKSEEEKNV